MRIVASQGFIETDLVITSSSDQEVGSAGDSVFYVEEISKPISVAVYRVVQVERHELRKANRSRTRSVDGERISLVLLGEPQEV